MKRLTAERPKEESTLLDPVLLDLENGVGDCVLDSTGSR
jgi:hypothetical protein